MNKFGGNSVTENYQPTVEDVLTGMLKDMQKFRPIPSYIKGGTAPDGLAIVGERGREIIKGRWGKDDFTPSWTRMHVPQLDQRQALQLPDNA